VSAGAIDTPPPAPPPTARRNPSGPAVIIFGVLVAATFAAFFVAQRLKNAPTVVQGLSRTPRFSPNGDGRFDRARVTFKLKKADDVTVEVLNTDGDVVKTLLDDRHIGPYEPIQPALRWDGTTDDGGVAPDGRYRVKITLRREGRALIPEWSILKDTKPPEPRVTSIGPQKSYGPELLPEADGTAAQIHFGPALGDRARLHIFRTAPGKPREVVTPVRLAPGAKRYDWNGKDDTGRAVSPGTYLVVPEWRDAAGNIGTSVPLNRDGLPILGHGRLPGRGGITVRYLGARPPVIPYKARDPMEVDVDARRARYSWSIRRVAGPTVNRSNNPKTSTRVRFRAPGGKSGVYVFAARTATHQTTVVFPVQARQAVAGTAAKPRGVLVLLPAVTWQGRNPLDADGDGAPDTLDRDVPVRPFRIMAGSGLPQGFADREAHVLRWLDRNGKRYDVTTDAALLAGRGPRLTGHHGVLIPGDARWLPARVRQDLRAFARRGGTVVSVGIDSLRRSVRLDAKGRLAHPTAERRTDLFGARIAPLAQRTTDLEVFQEDPQVDLFKGGPGLFTGIQAWEATERAGPDADLVTRAVTGEATGAKTVIVGVRFGKGLVLRPGFADFAPRLSSPTPDPAIAPLMARMWTLLSR
jgi:hypothetical protein